MIGLDNRGVKCLHKIYVGRAAVCQNKQSNLLNAFLF